MLSALQTHACTFMDCNFEYAHLNGSLHRTSAFISCRFGGASLFAAEMVGCKGTASSFIKANTAGWVIRGGNFSYALLSGAKFKKDDLSDMNFSHADMQDCDLSFANLSGCDLSYAMLQGASLIGADLRGADITGTDLGQCRMKGTKIDLQQAVLLAQRMGASVE